MKQWSKVTEFVYKNSFFVEKKHALIAGFIGLVKFGRSINQNFGEKPYLCTYFKFNRHYEL